MNKRIEQTEAIHLGFQVVFKQGVKTAHLGVHHNDILCDTLGAEQRSFVGYGYGQIAHLFLTLKRLCNLYSSGTIGVGLDHAYDACLRFEKRTVMVQVLHHGTEVYLQYRLVYLLFKSFCYNIEMKRTCTLDEHYAITQILELWALHELICTGKERASGIQIGKT